MNLRYPSLQIGTHFISGDIDQFKTKVLSHSASNKKVNNTNNKKLNACYRFNFNVSNLFQNIDETTYTQTFKYIYHKFRKGIFIRIRNNKVELFLPFMKKNYKNEWAHRISFDKKQFKTLQSMADKSHIDAGFKSYKIKHIDYWYANNFLVRYENFTKETFNNVKECFEMFSQLCKVHNIPDIDFFINKRDFPLLTRSRHEPYDSIFGPNHPLVSHSYKKHVPILSMVNHNQFADIAIPTPDDWNQPHSNITSIPWKQKRNRFVFRGSSTGQGVCAHTNMRLKLALLSRTDLRLDVEITKWQNRLRIINREVKLMDIKKMKELGLWKPDIYVDFYGKKVHCKLLSKKNGLSTVRICSNQKVVRGITNKRISSYFYLSRQKQSEYKFIINVPGNVCAFRLGQEMSLHSCILLVESPYKTWFHHLMKPFTHYIPIKSDLSDLKEKIDWCIQHDNKCEIIAKNAYRFYKTYLTRSSQLDYLKDLMHHLHNATNTSHTSTYETEFYNKQKQCETKCMDQYKSVQLDDSKCSLVYKNNKGSTVHNYENKFVVKHHKNIVHESFMSLQVINSFTSLIPNFVKGYRYHDKLVYEYVHGKTLKEWLQSNFHFKTFIHIIHQLSLTLTFAQRKAFFMHNDLTPNNIIIKKLNQPVNIRYRDVIITTDTIPVVIDYDVSKCIHQNIHHGIIHPLQFSPVNDIRMLLITSFDKIPTSKLYTHSQELLTLFKFVHPCTTVPDLLHYIHYERKYEELISLKPTYFNDFDKYFYNHFGSIVSPTTHILESKNQIESNPENYNKKWMGMIDKIKYNTEIIPSTLESMSHKVVKRSLQLDSYTHFKTYMCASQIKGSCSDKYTHFQKDEYYLNLCRIKTMQHYFSKLQST